MPKLRKRTSRYDQLQTLLYGQIRVQGVKPETLTCSRSGGGWISPSTPCAQRSNINNEKGETNESNRNHQKGR